MVKQENVDLYREEAMIGLVAFRDMMEAASAFLAEDKKSQGYTQPTRDEIRQKHLDDLLPTDIVVRQAKILIKLADDTTPPVYKVVDKDKTDGTAQFLAIEGNALAFDPATLPAIA